MDRRAFFTGLASSFVAAPAVVRATSLMPVRGLVMPIVTNDDLIRRLNVFRMEIIREYVHKNLFEPYRGGELETIIRVMS